MISAIDPPSEEYEWERVYPVLADDSMVGDSLVDTTWTQDVKNLDGAVFGELSTTLTGLNDNVSKLSSVTDAAGATNEYASRISNA